MSEIRPTPRALTVRRRSAPESQETERSAIRRPPFPDALEGLAPSIRSAGNDRVRGSLERTEPTGGRRARRRINPLVALTSQAVRRTLGLGRVGIGAKAAITTLLMVALVTATGLSPARAQQSLPIPGPQPHNSLCFLSVSLAPGTVPAAPFDLTAWLAPPEPLGAWPPGLPGVHLQWQPVANADCLGIDVLWPNSAQWQTTIETTGAAIGTDIQPPQLFEPGRSCFRVFAANKAGHSGYSNISCADVAGVEITYPAGWNLVAGQGPPGPLLTGMNGPLYTLQPGDVSYETIPPNAALSGNSGYWAFFDAPTTEHFGELVSIPGQRQLPAEQWVMIGNGSVVQSMALSGADVVYVYDPTTASYREATVLKPGQGAWAYSADGGSVTFTPVAP